METGKVECAPDYKSKKLARPGADLIDAAQRIWNDSEADKERFRLERDLINAALAKRKAEKIYHEGKEVGYSTLTAYVDADLKLAEVTDRLIEFEESLKK